MRHLTALAVLLAVITSGLEAQTTTSEQTTLAPGDSIRISVWRRPELSGDFVIGPDGSITHPLYRSVRVGSVPTATAENNLRTFLRQFDETPQFVMEPLVRVSVSGEVLRPQLFAISPQTTISQAVALAGGTTVNGKRNRVRVLRTDRSGDQRDLTVDLTRPDAGMAGSPVRSGDQIVVERRRNLFRDTIVPALTVVGSLASLYIFIDRTRN